MKGGICTRWLGPCSCRLQRYSYRPSINADFDIKKDVDIKSDIKKEYYKVRKGMGHMPEGSLAGRERILFFGGSQQRLQLVLGWSSSRMPLES